MSAPERSILGAVLLNAELYDEAVGVGLTPEDFSLDSHRVIFRGMCALAESSSALDIVTVVNYLDSHKDLARVGDTAYISSLIDGVPDRPSIKHYVRIVKEKAAQRKLARACEVATTRLSAEMTSRDAMEYLTDQMLQVQTGSDESPSRRVMEFSGSTFAEWTKLSNSTSDLAGLTTGIEALDMDTTGIREGERWIYAGRTGDGKTNLALQTIAANCHQGIPVVMFSIEMGKEALLQRLWASEAMVDYNQHPFS